MSECLISLIRMGMFFSIGAGFPVQRTKTCIYLDRIKNFLNGQVFLNFKFLYFTCLLVMCWLDCWNFLFGLSLWEKEGPAWILAQLTVPVFLFDRNIAKIYT